ncbi:hypothetical protein IWW57_006313 [Coemansia sp. S610]|uniref:SH3 domain-containing protein n=2 Tax=Coemansia TaxID=4863 RepID=A0A9W8L703_9FUNG|nr:hypothetical protein LPJ60_005376 [Coemansia sp. RSA 2675]KAJ2012447.1 hypothetical protein IWW57_006313 [Coemansia sp. S610]KAJ2414205.1 hypothetical protein GGI10_002541 [Coemansia sp. RSA 2530]KAJ2690220.1 hypothetical protein IWW39_000901 [Coemansia spiralis]KAJ2700180.1 hypothetical protein H4218_002173 [Coemansia sp. IMI 209128]
MTASFKKRYTRLISRPAPNRNRLDLTVDTNFVIAHTNFDSQYKGILSVRKGDIIRVQRNGDAHPKWWLGTIVKSYYKNKGYGYFFPVLTEPYNFMDNRIATRVPKMLLNMRK